MTEYTSHSLSPRTVAAAQAAARGVPFITHCEAVLPDVYYRGVQGALVSRGKRKGALKAKCPSYHGKPAYAHVAWQAITLVVNPMRCSVAGVIAGTVIGDKADAFDQIGDVALGYKLWRSYRNRNRVQDLLDELEARP